MAIGRGFTIRANVDTSGVKKGLIEITAQMSKAHEQLETMFTKTFKMADKEFAKLTPLYTKLSRNMIPLDKTSISSFNELAEKIKKYRDQLIGAGVDAKQVELEMRGLLGTLRLLKEQGFTKGLAKPLLEEYDTEIPKGRSKEAKQQREQLERIAAQRQKEFELKLAAWQTKQVELYDIDEFFGLGKGGAGGGGKPPSGPDPDILAREAALKELSVKSDLYYSQMVANAQLAYAKMSYAGTASAREQQLATESVLATQMKANEEMAMGGALWQKMGIQPISYWQEMRTNAVAASNQMKAELTGTEQEKAAQIANINVRLAEELAGIDKQINAGAIAAEKEIEAAWKTLGITTDATFAKMVVDAEAAYNKITSLGTASARELQLADEARVASRMAASEGMAAGGALWEKMGIQPVAYWDKMAANTISAAEKMKASLVGTEEEIAMNKANINLKLSKDLEEIDKKRYAALIPLRDKEIADAKATAEKEIEINAAKLEAEKAQWAGYEQAIKVKMQYDMGAGTKPTTSTPTGMTREAQYKTLGIRAPEEIQKDIDQLRIAYKEALAAAQGNFAEQARIHAAFNTEEKAKYAEMNNIIKQQGKEVVPPSAWKTLGIRSTEEIQAQKTQVQAAYQQITSASNVSIQNRINAERRYSAEMQRLNNEMVQRVEMSYGAIARAVLRFYAAYFVVSQGIGFIVRQFTSAMETIDKLKVSAISVSASIVNAMPAGGNIAEQYKQARDYADALAIKLLEVDVHSLANYEQLLLMNRAMAQHGVLIDLNNQKQVDTFTALSNAIALYTVGQGQEQQMSQETNALLTGEVSNRNRIAKMIDIAARQSGIYAGGLKEIVKLGQQHGDTMERLAPFLRGVNAASEDILFTWQSVTTSFQTAWMILQRDVFKDVYDSAVKWGRKTADYIRENSREISEKIKTVGRGTEWGIKAAALTAALYPVVKIITWAWDRWSSVLGAAMARMVGIGGATEALAMSTGLVTTGIGRWLLAIGGVLLGFGPLKSAFLGLALAAGTFTLLHWVAQIDAVKKAFIGFKGAWSKTFEEVGYHIDVIGVKFDKSFGSLSEEDANKLLVKLAEGRKKWYQLFNEVIEKQKESDRGTKERLTKDIKDLNDQITELQSQIRLLDMEKQRKEEQTAGAWVAKQYKAVEVTLSLVPKLVWDFGSSIIEAIDKLIDKLIEEWKSRLVVFSLKNIAKVVFLGDFSAEAVKHEKALTEQILKEDVKRKLALKDYLSMKLEIAKQQKEPARPDVPIPTPGKDAEEKLGYMSSDTYAKKKREFKENLDYVLVYSRSTYQERISAQQQYNEKVKELDRQFQNQKKGEADREETLYGKYSKQLKDIKDNIATSGEMVEKLIDLKRSMEKAQPKIDDSAWGKMKANLEEQANDLIDRAGGFKIRLDKIWGSLLSGMGETSPLYFQLKLEEVKQKYKDVEEQVNQVKDYATEMLKRDLSPKIEKMYRDQLRIAGQQENEIRVQKGLEALKIEQERDNAILEERKDHLNKIAELTSDLPKTSDRYWKNQEAAMEATYEAEKKQIQDKIALVKKEIVLRLSGTKVEEEKSVAENITGSFLKGADKLTSQFLDGVKNISSTFIKGAKDLAVILSGVTGGKKGYAEGGIATGPNSGYYELLHGAEAVIPLKGGSVPVEISLTKYATTPPREVPLKDIVYELIYKPLNELNKTMEDSVILQAQIAKYGQITQAEESEFERPSVEKVGKILKEQASEGWKRMGLFEKRFGEEGPPGEYLRGHIYEAWDRGPKLDPLLGALQLTFAPLTAFIEGIEKPGLFRFFKDTLDMGEKASKWSSQILGELTYFITPGGKGIKTGAKVGEELSGVGEKIGLSIKIVDSELQEAARSVQDFTKKMKYTTDTREAGFISPEGKMLDLSEGYEGERRIDHWDYAIEHGFESLDKFMEQGFLRMEAGRTGGGPVLGHPAYMTMLTEPTKAQYNVIQKLIEEGRGAHFQLESGRSRGYIDIDAGSMKETKEILEEIRDFWKIQKPTETDEMTTLLKAVLVGGTTAGAATGEQPSYDKLVNSIPNFEDIIGQISATFNKEIQLMSETLVSGSEDIASSLVSHAPSSMNLRGLQHGGIIPSHQVFEAAEIAPELAISPLPRDGIAVKIVGLSGEAGKALSTPFADELTSQWKNLKFGGPEEEGPKPLSLEAQNIVRFSGLDEQASILEDMKGQAEEVTSSIVDIGTSSKIVTSEFDEISKLIEEVNTKNIEQKEILEEIGKVAQKKGIVLNETEKEVIRQLMTRQNLLKQEEVELAAKEKRRKEQFLQERNDRFLNFEKQYVDELSSLSYGLLRTDQQYWAIQQRAVELDYELFKTNIKNKIALAKTAAEDIEKQFGKGTPEDVEAQENIKRMEIFYEEEKLAKAKSVNFAERRMVIEKAQYTGNALQTMEAAWDQYFLNIEDGTENTSRIMYQMWTDTLKNMETGLSDLFSQGILMKFDTMKEAWKNMWNSMKQTFARAIADMMAKEIMVEIGFEAVLESVKEYLGVASSVTAATALTGSSVALTGSAGALTAAAAALTAAAAALSSAAGVQATAAVPTSGAPLAAAGGTTYSPYIAAAVAAAYTLYQSWKFAGGKEPQTFGEKMVAYTTLPGAIGTQLGKGGRKEKWRSESIGYDEETGILTGIPYTHKGQLVDTATIDPSIIHTLTRSTEELGLYRETLDKLPSWVSDMSKSLQMEPLINSIDAQAKTISVKTKGWAEAAHILDISTAKTLTEGLEDWQAEITAYYDSLAQATSDIVSNAFASGLQAPDVETGTQAFLSSMSSGLFDTIESTMIQALSQSDMYQSAISPFLDTLNMALGDALTSGVPIEPGSIMLSVKPDLDAAIAKIKEMAPAFQELYAVMGELESSLVTSIPQVSEINGVFADMGDYVSSLTDTLTPAEQKIAQVRGQFETWIGQLKELGATEADVARATDTMNDALEVTRTNEINSIWKDMNTAFNSIVHPVASFVEQLQSIESQFDTWITGLIQAGASQAEVTKALGLMSLAMNTAAASASSLAGSIGTTASVAQIKAVQGLMTSLTGLAAQADIAGISADIQKIVLGTITKTEDTIVATTPEEQKAWVGSHTTTTPATYRTMTYQDYLSGAGTARRGSLYPLDTATLSSWFGDYLRGIGSTAVSVLGKWLLPANATDKQEIWTQFMTTISSNWNKQIKATAATTTVPPITEAPQTKVVTKTVTKTTALAEPYYTIGGVNYDIKAIEEAVTAFGQLASIKFKGVDPTMLAEWTTFLTNAQTTFKTLEDEIKTAHPGEVVGLGPVEQEIYDQIGVLVNEISGGKVAKTIDDLIAKYTGSIAEAFKASNVIEAAKSFGDIIHQNLYQSIIDAVTTAFMNSTIYKSAMGPFTEAIENAINAASAGGGFNTALFQSLITPTLAGLSGVLNQISPAFKELYEALRVSGLLAFASNNTLIGNTVEQYQTGGYISKPTKATLAERGAEWVVPTVEPERSAFLRNAGVDVDRIGRALAKNLIIKDSNVVSMFDYLNKKTEQIFSSFSNMKTMYEQTNPSLMGMIKDYNEIRKTRETPRITSVTSATTKGSIEGKEIISPPISQSKTTQVVVKVDMEALGKTIAKAIQGQLGISLANSGNEKEVHIHLHIDGKEIANVAAAQLEGGHDRFRNAVVKVRG